MAILSENEINKLKRISGIYKFKNNINNKIYIGMSNHIKRRYFEHKRHYLNIEKINYFYKALRKYGFDNFSFEIICECKESELKEKEIFYIKLYNSYKKGYNITKGGDTSGAIGEKNPNSKLTEDDVYNIRESYNNKENKRSVYEKYKHLISFNTFHDAWTGKTWNTINMKCYTKENKTFYKRHETYGLTKHEEERMVGKEKRQLAKENARKIREMMKKGISLIEIKKHFKNMPYSTFHNIVKGHTFKNI